jgi:hypothetical protein
VIRQTISCDICKSEKKESNHWYVVYEQGGELRLSGWNSRQRMRPDARHLCGQSCVYKLVEDFLARVIATRGPQDEGREHSAIKRPPARAQIAANILTDTSLTSNAAYDDVEEYARLVTPGETAASAGRLTSAGLAAANLPGIGVVVPLDESARQAQRTRRAEAWEREREREVEEAEPKPDFVGRSAGRLL